jgi:hypothetical protein
LDSVVPKRKRKIAAGASYSTSVWITNVVTTFGTPAGKPGSTLKYFSRLAPKEALGGGPDTWPGGLGRMLAGRDRRSEDRSRPLEEESSSEIA